MIAVVFRPLSVLILLILSVKGVWADGAALSQTIILSGYRSTLVLLLIVRTFSCLLVMPVIDQGENLYLFLALILMRVFSAKFFVAASSISLFINFELRLIPIFLIILG